MDHSPRNEERNQAGPSGRRPVRRALLAALGAGLLWLAWAGYSQPGLLLQLANLRYCG